MILDLRNSNSNRCQSYVLTTLDWDRTKPEEYILSNESYPKLEIRRVNTSGYIVRIHKAMFLDILETLGAIARDNIPLSDNHNFYTNYKVCVRYKPSHDLCHRTELIHDRIKSRILFEITTYRYSEVTLSQTLWVPLSVLMLMLTEFNVFTSIIKRIYSKEDKDANMLEQAQIIAKRERRRTYSLINI